MKNEGGTRKRELGWGGGVANNGHLYTIALRVSIQN